MTTRMDRGRMVLETTLLELVSVMSTLEKNEEAVVAGVVELVRDGGVKLTGTFRDVPLDRLFAA